MRPIVTIALIAGGYYALTALNKARGAGKLEFYPYSVDFSGLTLTNWTFTVQIEVLNPSKVKQNINAIFGSVYAGSRQVARIQQTTPQTISKQGTTIINVPVKLTADGAGYLLAQLAKANIPSITVKGTVDTMGIQVPFEQTLN